MTPAAANLRVIVSCPLRWNVLRGDEQAHYCQLCRVNVQNLSVQSESQRDVLAATLSGAAHVCVAYLERPDDGSIITRPRWWPLWLWRGWWLLASRFGRRKLPLGWRRRLGQPVMGRVAVRRKE